MCRRVWSSSQQRKHWLQRPPGPRAPWYAFRTVAHRWVSDNPRSRESVMREALQGMFQKPFLKVRPTFLTNPATGYPLELDAYSEELKLAAEFQGVQHYEFPNPFHSTRAQFEAQQQRDALKVRLCADHGVRLLVVPHTVARNDIHAFLKLALDVQTTSASPDTGANSGFVAT